MLIVRMCLLIIAVLFAQAAFAAEYTVLQKDKTFMKGKKALEKMTVKKGDVINFKNEDPFFHNVFSLTDIQTFDLGSYPAGKSKSVKFEKKGTVEVECAIHPQMFMEVVVK